MGKNVIIGTRGSKLALAQSQWVARELEELHDDLSVELKIIKTSGDRLQTALDAEAEAKKLEKGLFTREIEQALLDREIDLAVHSLKDLPVDNPKGLTIGAIPVREASQDLVILKKGIALNALPDGCKILTGSLRRELQWKEMYPKTEVSSIRGNVDTRLRKLNKNQTAVGIILAEAGLNRLQISLTDFETHTIPSEQMLPAPGQGALGIQMREDDSKVHDFLIRIHHHTTSVEVNAERMLLKALGGGCNEPMGALAKFDGNLVTIDAVYYSDKNDASSATRCEMSASLEDCEEMCHVMAQELTQQVDHFSE